MAQSANSLAATQWWVTPSANGPSVGLLQCRSTSGIVKVFGCRPYDDGATYFGAGVGKPPREETAGRDTRRFVTHYGDLIAAGDAPERRRADPAHRPTQSGW